MRPLGSLKIYGLKSSSYRPIPPEEVDELYYCVDDISGDGQGLN